MVCRHCIEAFGFRSRPSGKDPSMPEFHPLIAVQPRAGRRRSRRARGFAVVCAATLAVIGLLAVAQSHRGFVLVNGTSSEPPGLYARAMGEPIRPGSLVAFMAPPAAYPYADQHMPFLRSTPIIKAVAAVAGDRVCTVGGVLTINGVVRAPIRQRDSQGFALPRWIACRRLEPGELFAFSNRVPTSFDSRYYGPVRVALAQPYRTIITTEGFGR
jgi:conjugative transfer signal peptidase TraF